MKKLNTLGYFATFFTALYAVFKFVQIPGAAWFMLLAGIMLAIYFPFLFLNRLRKKMGGKLNLVYKFGGILLAMFILSSVEQHGYEIGKNAARLLLDRIEKEKEYPVQTKIIKTELVIKGSSMRKKN